MLPAFVVVMMRMGMRVIVWSRHDSTFERVP
jgi:hypothetical protein